MYFTLYQGSNLMIKPIAIQGICFDDKSSFLSGAALAPAKIRAAFNSKASNYFAENGIKVSPDRFTDKGDFQSISYEDITSITGRHLTEGYRLITLGGDHSISYPVLKAYRKHYDQIHILQVDAHSDLYHEFEGDPYSHACPFARIMEDQLALQLIQVGIRTLSDHQKAQANKFGVEIQEMKHFDPGIVQKLKGPLYISVDIDALDPAFAPGVSHKEPGGLSSRQLIGLIQEIETDIIGADIVEFNPTRDIHDLTAALCAKLLKEILSKMLST